MRFMKTSRTRQILGVGVGAALAAGLGVVVAPGQASAKTRGGALRIVDVNVGGLDSVYQNEVIQVIFTSQVNPASVNPAIFQIREQNAKGKGFTKQIPGSFQVVGSIVRFYPRLPTHLRDPDPLNATNEFYPVGSPRDDANLNAALQPDLNYELKIIGGGGATVARSINGRRLAKTYSTRFSTTPLNPKSQAFTIDTYGDAPPPKFAFSNPSDKVASAGDQYARHGGTQGVLNDLHISMYVNSVPLSPTSLRAPGNVTLQLTERFGETKFAKPIPGNAYVEQNFDGTTIVYDSRFPLPDRGTYALKVTAGVKDLTEVYDFAANEKRLALRNVYEFMEEAARLQPGTPHELLPDPDPIYVEDWPQDPTLRGILKKNVLLLGRTYPYEVDPRVMVLFTTRDEPVSTGQAIIEFTKAEGLKDDVLTTANYDEDPNFGSAFATFTIAGGSGSNGDFLPVQATTINMDTFPNRTVNWRKMVVPVGVVISFTGTRPASVKALTLQLDGELRADGLDGGAAYTGSYFSPSSPPTQAKGGAGGPGGGAGGDENTSYTSATYNGVGGTGKPGVDLAGVPAAVGDGGQGGLGGIMATGTVYNMGGSGGGGGARTAGSAGQDSVPPSTSSTYAAWVGKGGQGGAGSTNDDQEPQVGGAGGGAGANGEYKSQGWAKQGAGGGGGGGALTVQTSGLFNMGSTAAIRARGGKGGQGGGSPYTISGGCGGGGGGGTVLLRSSKRCHSAHRGAATDVRGGAGGTQTGSYLSPSGGVGGNGYVRTESPTGGITIPNATGGTFDPSGGGVPSFVYTLWSDLGVDSPRMVNFSLDDFVLSAGGNDAVFIEMQMAVENTALFGTPLLTGLNPITQDSTNFAVVSPWVPVRVIDLTRNPAGAFGNIPGYDIGTHGTDYIFPIATALNGKDYKFFRIRARFQLDDVQSSKDPVPFIDRIKVNFEFNI